MKATWKNIAGKLAVCFAFAVIGIIGVHQYRQEVFVEELSSKIIRFHVLANSDSEEDQELKLRVRDAIGTYLQQELGEITDAEQSRSIILQDMDQIVETARAVVEEHGYSYEISASLTRTDFPQKTYGPYTFPAGEYEALQVEIGQGEGKNWWCVMYPNLCFFNSVYQVVEKEAEKSLQRVLTTEEYAAIMEDGDYEVKFKWLSFLNK